jgi:hypothetical protein
VTVKRAPRSWWIWFVETFLLWIGGRSIYFAVLSDLDPNYRMAMESGFGPQLVVVEILFGILAIGAGVAIYLRYKHALMMATAALAIYTGLNVAQLWQSANNLPAFREAYKASRDARGLPITEERLDMMFSPEAMPMLWIVLALLCIPPYVILLWRKHELEPVEETTEDDG